MDETFQQEVNRIASEYLKELERERQTLKILHGLEQFEDHHRCTKER